MAATGLELLSWRGRHEVLAGRVQSPHHRVAVTRHEGHMKRAVVALVVAVLAAVCADAGAARAALASEANGQRGDSSNKVRAPDARPELGSPARAADW